MPIPENNQIPCKSQIEHISAMNQQTNHYRYAHAYKLHLQPPGYKTLSAWRTYYDRSNGEAGEANCCNTANLQKDTSVCHYGTLHANYTMNKIHASKQKTIMPIVSLWQD